MTSYQSKIDKLSAILEDQEIALGLRRKRRTAEVIPIPRNSDSAGIPKSVIL
jgi:hypothetical protein